MQIIVKDRSRLIRQQRAVINYVHKKDNPYDSKVQEAMKDFQRWSQESGVYKDLMIDDVTGEPLSKNCKWITSFERERRKKVGTEE